MVKSHKLKILFIEDLPSDVEMAIHTLKAENIIFDHQAVCTGKDMLIALKEFNPDLIISDFSMPSFDGMQALKLSKEFNPDIPFILFTGSVNEETAVKCIKEGAVDYVIKEHITRLPFAVKEAINQSLARKEKRASELLLKDREEKLQSIFRAAPVGIGFVVNRVIMEVNDKLCSILGYSRGDLIGKSSLILYPDKEEYEYVGKEKYRQIDEQGTGVVETRFKSGDGTILNVILSSAPVDYQDYSKGVTFTILDITDRKQREVELKESYRQINTLIGNLRGIAYQCRNDKEWTMEFLSEGTLELTGYSPEELIGNKDLSYAGLIFSEDKEQVWENVQKALANRTHFECTYRIETRAGEVKWVWEKGEGIFEESGEVGFLEGFITDITDRKEVEEALTRSEERFRSIAENISDVIFIINSEGLLTYVSPASVSVLGYLPEECLGRFFGDFLADGELEKAQHFFQNAINSVDPEIYASLSVKRKNGAVIFAELTGSPFTSVDNTGVIGVLRDVSHKVKQDNELRKLSQAVEQSPVSVIITSIRGDIEYVNPKFCEVTGYSKDELIGLNPRVLSSGEKSKEEYKLLWDTILAGNDWKGEFHNKKKNGELYWESATISPIKNNLEVITHFIGIKEDITLRKILEDATHESEKRYRELFLNNPVPTYIFDEQTLEFIEVNEAAIENYGFSRTEFINMTLKDIRSPEDLPDLLDSVQNLDSKVFHSAKMRHTRKNGTVFPVEVVSHSLPEKDGRKSRLVMATDITERKYAAEQMQVAKEKAEASDRLKTTFLNNISHEVRTPLNGILGFAEIMTQPNISEEDRKISVSMLQESSDRLLNTITNYMDISIVTSGNLVVSKKNFSPADLLIKLRNTYASLCEIRNLNLVLDIPEQLNNLIVESDPEILYKIINQLINNALKFTSSGSIQFGIGNLNEEIVYYVKDSGIGIAKESLDTIFDRFVKEERGGTHVSEGSGLGLSIAKEMVSALGGKIWAESEQDVGSCFYISLPASGGTPADQGDSHKPDVIGKETDHLILVAEDDDANFFYINAVLKRGTKARILRASNGREAIDLFMENPEVSLILMDIKMPEIDGLEATRQIKSFNINVPVIALTAYAMSGDEERVLNAGCDGYLSKPITKTTLLEKISEFIII